MNIPARRDLPGHESRKQHLMSELSTLHRTPPRRRLFFSALAASALATGTAVALIIPGLHDETGRPHELAPDASVTLAGAPAVLVKASQYAANEPELKPARGQFMYFESKSAQSGILDERGQGQPPEASHRHVWLPAFGGQAGLLREDGGQGNGTWLCHKNDGATPPAEEKVEEEIDLAKPPTGCEDAPAYRTDLPTDVKAMKDWLYRNSHGGNPPDVQAFVTVGDTIREAYVGPKSLAAMFKATAEIPGTKVYDNVTDSAGRPGIAVGQTFHGVRHDLIFDPETFKYLGERQVVDYDDSFHPSGGKSPEETPWQPSAEMRKNMPEGKVLFMSAALRVAVVNEVGQR
ncbi:CU044_5270 family protein [Nonomuraea sp. NPDC050547]|uniref:CU044_5270 family protein n=1 Tax=Nonomuraea sp. NPDC050547 TaxID=3364368 RepID=UPI00379E33DD